MKLSTCPKSRKGFSVELRHFFSLFPRTTRILPKLIIMSPVTHYHFHRSWTPDFNALILLPVEFQPNVPTLTFAPSFSLSPTFTIPPGTELLAFSGKTVFKRLSLVGLCISGTFVLIYASYTYTKYLSSKYQLPRRIYNYFKS